MDKLFLKAYGKLNLGLDVLGIREDGYHEVKMVMQSVNLYDGIEIEKTDKKDIEIETNLYYLPLNENNIVYKATKLLFDEFGINEGVKIKLDKRIPVAAGMAGGSADAAAVLRGINKMFNLGLKRNDLMERGGKIGADVPYCILNGTALATGIGEKIEPLTDIEECYILLAKPNVNISTKSIYTELDEIEIKNHPDIDLIVSGLKEKNLRKVALNMGNVLELVTIPKCPVITDIKKKMIDGGAINSMMSGSGPTVFGIFENEEDAYQTKKDIMDMQCTNLVYVTKTFNPKRRNGEKNVKTCYEK